ncbi:alpha-2-macroglobulin family protein [Puia sp.]|uniref:alpha-2-macroglobulin family protein n=1 Tax=Puia sp. TaxID=2045100 RepID=UPI002F417D6A
MRSLLFPTLLLLPFWTVAQHDLSTSPQHSAAVYAYRLTDVQARKLYTTDLAGWKKIPLPPPADSFPFEQQEEPPLSPGDYLFIQTVENQLQVTLRTIGSLHCSLLANGDQAALVLHDAAGRPVTDATVTVRGHAVHWDPAAGCYFPGRWSKTRIARVSYRGTIYFFPVDHQSRRFAANRFAWWRRFWDPQRYPAYHPRPASLFRTRYKSFFVLSKPKYKPGDTVSGKAFIFDRKGRPFQALTALRLSGRGDRKDTILTWLNAYRPGAYTFSFVLTDSLKLQLDDQYTLSLEIKRKAKDKDDDDDDADDRKVLSECTFKYEEYDLTSIRLEGRADRREQYPGQPLSVYLRALDENDLPIPDGRIEVTVTSDRITGFHDPAVFVPYTLWHWTQTLDPIGETRIILPDSIYPAASFGYRIECLLLNSDNEVFEKDFNVTYYGEPARIVFHPHGDSLDIGYHTRRQSVPATGIVTTFDWKAQRLTTLPVSLPTTLRVNPMAVSYEVTAINGQDSVKGEYSLTGIAAEIPVHSKRTKDTVEFITDDSLHLPFWYAITMGERLIRRGYGDRLDFRQRPEGPAPYRLRLQYLWKGILQTRTVNLPIFERRLNIDVRQPKYVYPGEQVDIAVAVTDVSGRPVADADLTAWSWTAKFRNAPLPSVPYFGKQYRYKPIGSYSPVAAIEQKRQSQPLKESRWKALFRLDTLEYYKFLDPRTIYVNRQPSPDNITQIAPFVSRQGQPEPVYLIYLDERLIFFDRAEQWRSYSFPAGPGWHTLRLRVSDREIKIDSFLLTPGMKTTIGINDDTANPAIHIRPMPDSLTDWERQLLHQSLITVQSSFLPHFATITQGGDHLYLLAPPNSTSTPNSFLAGPFSGGNATLEVKDRFRQFFEPEGGYQFIIRPGLIKEKQWPYDYPFGEKLSPTRILTGLGDRALTPAITDSLWQDWLDNRSATQDLYLNEHIWRSGGGDLQIGIPTDSLGKPVFVKKVFVFRYTDADYLHIFKGQTTMLGRYEPGLYRILLLLKGDRYLLHDSVVVRPNGYNYFGFDRLPVKAPDTFSRRIAGILRRIEDQWVDPYSPGMDSLHFFFNDRFMEYTVFDQEATGIVTDDAGTPLQGVTVQVKSTRHAVPTDNKGQFHLRIPARGTIVFTCVGFESITRAFSRPEYYRIKLNPLSMALNDVVVIGYGATKRMDMTGSVSLSEVTLSGKVAGVSVNSTGEAQDQSLPQALVQIPPMPGLDTVRSIRRRFKDDAFWLPRLHTDARGMASFKVTYPDDITSWNTFFVAVADHRQTGAAAAGVRSLKPLSARLSNPNFLIAGDSAFVIGKLLNYGPDTVTVRRRFNIGDANIADDPVHFRIARIDTFLLHPAGTMGPAVGPAGAIPHPDSIRFSYTLQRADGYFDGEERSIPVLTTGVKETRGTFAPLEGDTSLRLQFDSTRGPVHIYASADLLPVMLDEIERIRQYEYLCNEQLASKLLALLQKKRIYALEQKEFKEEKNIGELIGKLMQGRRGKALWGWWEEGTPVSWISLHVTEALLSAEKAGYTTGLDKQPLIDFLVYNYERGTSLDRLLDLRMLQDLDARVDYRRYTDTAAKYLLRRSLYQTLRLEEIRQTAGLPTGLDTMAAKRQYTALGNCYWGEDGALFFDNSIQITLLMYRLLRKAGGYDPILRKTRNWLLEKRGRGYWRNTYESSLILETLLPDLLAGGRPAQAPSLTLNGNRVTAFPYENHLPAGAAIDIRKSGTLPVYFTAFQQYLNPAPEKVVGAFAVQTWFEQDGKIVQRLKAGQPAVLMVEVDVKGEADYVLVEAPIPAGCTYSEKGQWFGDQSIHSEYFKYKLSIFCQSMRKGKQVFSIRLMPRWTGYYRLNPARAELQYFPVLFGREGMKRTVIE